MPFEKLHFSYDLICALEKKTVFLHQNLLCKAHGCRLFLYIAEYQKFAYI